MMVEKAVDGVENHPGFAFQGLGRHLMYSEVL
jgi:hypothetical protein